ncbi:MAG: helix-turn-helix domain-containing protein [Oscillospiraceae bacterium]|nr:helix-turn-helix domain-containing protein [Oscillospiraceae bacterium]
MKPYDRKIVASRLRELRERCKWTQNDVGERLNSLLGAKALKLMELDEDTGKETVSQLETLKGKRNISQNLAFAYAEIFDVSLDYIYGRTDTWQHDYKEAKELLRLSNEAIDALRLLSEPHEEDDEYDELERDDDLRAMSKLIVGLVHEADILRKMGTLKYYKHELSYAQHLSDDDFEAEYPSMFDMIYASLLDTSGRKAQYIERAHESIDRIHWEISREFTKMVDSVLDSLATEDLADGLKDEEWIEIVARKRLELQERRNAFAKRNVSEMLADLDKEYERLKESILGGTVDGEP